MIFDVAPVVVMSADLGGSPALLVFAVPLPPGRLVVGGALIVALLKPK